MAAVLESGVRRVVIGCPDPDPHVLGGGGEALRRAGVEVCYGGAWADEAAALIAGWTTVIAAQR